MIRDALTDKLIACHEVREPAELTGKNVRAFSRASKA
jgi:hypothetical protein